MPKSTPAPKDQPAKLWDRKEAPRYVRCELSKEQKAALASWAEDLEDIDLLKWLAQRIESGHVLSLKSLPTGYQASLTGDREASGHMGISLISRASTAMRTLYACMYKDEMVLQGVWPASGSLEELDY